MILQEVGVFCFWVRCQLHKPGRIVVRYRALHMLVKRFGHQQMRVFGKEREQYGRCERQGQSAKFHIPEQILQMVDISLRYKHGNQLSVYHPRVCSMWASSNPATASPFIAPARSSLTSSNTLGS